MVAATILALPGDLMSLSPACWASWQQALTWPASALLHKIKLPSLFPFFSLLSHLLLACWLIATVTGLLWFPCNLVITLQAHHCSVIKYLAINLMVWLRKPQGQVIMMIRPYQAQSRLRHRSCSPLDVVHYHTLLVVCCPVPTNEGSQLCPTTVTILQRTRLLLPAGSQRPVHLQIRMWSQDSLFRVSRTRLAYFTLNPQPWARK